MGGGNLSADTKRRLTVASSLYYSSISAWEIARLQKEGKVVIPVDIEESLADLTALYGLSAIPPTDDIMLRAANLPDFHNYPADRIIIATALISGMPIVTGDSKFSQYGVRTFC
jgi:PIN domain nuclease of toxin-antitoxin system